MSNFCTLLKRKERHFTQPGSREANDYQIKIDKKGHKVLELVGTHDIYEEIQSYAEECKIENILARAAAGDVDALNQRQGYYEDITQTPRDLADAQNQILKLKQGFEKLDPETRAKFDNSPEKFIQEFGQDSWYENMGFTKEETAAAEKTEEVSFVPGTNNVSDQILTPEVSK